VAVFYATDVPAGDFDFPVPADVPEPDAVYLQVNGETVGATVDGDTVVGSWSGLPLPPVGAYPVYAVFTIDGGSLTRLVTTFVVDDASSGWLTIDQARAMWVNGAPESDGDLFRLLVVARTQVEAFAPALAVGATVPEHYRLGQSMQARNIWNAATVSPSTGDMEMGGMSFVVHPLDWTVKQLLRPKRAVPWVG
jgi:hypothetical protein